MGPCGEAVAEVESTQHPYSSTDLTGTQPDLLGKSWMLKVFLFVSILTPCQVVTKRDNKANWITAKPNLCLNTPSLCPWSRMGAPIISLDYILAEVSSLLG